jgi:hypothetical protein
MRGGGILPMLTPMNQVCYEGGSTINNLLAKQVQVVNPDNQMDNFGAYADLAIEITKQTQ